MHRYRLKITYFLAFFSILFSLCACSTREAIYKPGIYYNEAEGYHSTLLVQVEVDRVSITNISIVEHEEPDILSDIVFDELPPRIIKRNGTDIDGISGATYTSKALLLAVEKALEQAREANE